MIKVSHQADTIRSKHHMNRRAFLRAGGSALVAGVTAYQPCASAGSTAEPVIDIHQHTNYHGRSDAQLVAHQRAMGVTHTLLLPAGSPQTLSSTHQGRSNGLAAGCGGNETVERLAREHPAQFCFGANEVPDLPTARAEIDHWLKRGGRIIGEQKFGVACDGPALELVASLARDHQVPVLLHFQVGEYNLGFDRFWRTLEQFPTVNFIGHAQTWWSNVDEYWDGTSLYPTGPVTPGGLTDRYLGEYPNMFGDLSAGSGLNFLLRDEEHTRWFLDRHQDKLLFGSDCADALGRGPGCQGSQTLAAIRRLAPTRRVERKLLFENASSLLHLEGS
jgi:predicted TIM-barrel fold metal-dependent hydrolase